MAEASTSVHATSDIGHGCDMMRGKRQEHRLGAWRLAAAAAVAACCLLAASTGHTWGLFRLLALFFLFLKFAFALLIGSFI
jgi:hypothetical protein